VRLVHAVHETAPMAPMLPLISVETFAEVGRRIVHEAEQQVRELDPTQSVESVVTPGSAVHVLSAAGEHARMIVLGHRDRSLLGRVLTSSTTTGVGARAHCPVVSVPSTWTATHVTGRIVVGVDDSAPAKDALALAFSMAAERGARLEVLHAWKLPSAYDDIIVSRVMLEDWKDHATAEMHKTLAPWREEYPDVEVEIDIRHQYAAPALVGASEGADAVVIGRRGHGAPLGVYLGAVARTLIREARCPVVVAPHRRPQDVLPEQRVRPEEVAPQT
jgi:nucleotide-binding universal stress UspA family protein